jgi:hypothetical protein
MDESSQRRCEVRIGLNEPLMASAELRGTYFPAELVDLSESGAKFRFPECDAQLEIRQGYETGWTVCLPSGNLTRFQAEARWFHRVHHECIVGVKFLETMKTTLFHDLVRNVYLPA